MSRLSIITSFMKEIFVQKDITRKLRNNLPMPIPKARGITCPINLKVLKLSHHLKGKLKDGKMIFLILQRLLV